MRKREQERERGEQEREREVGWLRLSVGSRGGVFAALSGLPAARLCLFCGEYRSWTGGGVAYLLSRVGVWARDSAGKGSTRLWDIEEEWHQDVMTIAASCGCEDSVRRK